MKDYMINKHGVFMNPDYEILDFPKSYLFELGFSKAKTPNEVAMSFYWSNPTSGSGGRFPCTNCILDGITENEYKIESINHVITCLKIRIKGGCGVCPGWAKNIAPKVVNKLEEYKNQYAQEAA